MRKETAGDKTFFFSFCSFVMDGIQMAPCSNSQMAHGREMAHCLKAVCFLSLADCRDDYKDVCEATICVCLGINVDI